MLLPGSVTNPNNTHPFVINGLIQAGPSPRGRYKLLWCLTLAICRKYNSIERWFSFPPPQVQSQIRSIHIHTLIHLCCLLIWNRGFVQAFYFVGPGDGPFIPHWRFPLGCSLFSPCPCCGTYPCLTRSFRWCTCPRSGPTSRLVAVPPAYYSKHLSTKIRAALWLQKVWRLQNKKTISPPPRNKNTRLQTNH